MVEWFKAHAWKACEVKASAGSNPVLCANTRNTPLFCLGLLQLRPIAYQAIARNLQRGNCFPLCLTPL